MNERLKELCVEAGGVMFGELCGTLNFDVERFAELVRNVERKACADHYLQIMRDAVDAARLEERASCAKLLDDFAKTSMAPVKDLWRIGVMAAANAVRDKK